MRKFIAALCAAVMVLGSTATFVAAPSASANDVTVGTVTELKEGFNGATSEAGTVTIEAVSETVKSSAAAAVLDMIQDKAEAVKAKILALAEVSLPEGVKGGTIKFAVDGVYSNDTVDTIVVLHQKADGNWEQIKPSAVERGYVTATFSSLSPVAIVKVIPTAGDFGVGFSTVALVAAAGLAGAVVCGKKKSN